MKFVSSCAVYCLLVTLTVLSHVVPAAESKLFDDDARTEVEATIAFDNVEFEYHVVSADKRKKLLLMGIDNKDNTKCYLIRDDLSVWKDLQSDKYRPEMEKYITDKIKDKKYKANRQVFIRIQDRKAVEDCQGRGVYEMDYYPPLRKDRRKTQIFEDDGVEVWSKFSYQDFDFEEHVVKDKRVRLLIGINHDDKKCYYFKNEEVLESRLDNPDTRKQVMATVYEAMKEGLTLPTTVNDAVAMFNFSGFKDSRGSLLCANYETYRFDRFYSEWDLTYLLNVDITIR